MIEIDWKTIDDLCENLCQQIRKSGKEYAFIYGVPRGGVIPAVILSHKLDIRFTTDVYNPQKSKYLVVDDINDSGRTLFPFTREENVDTVVLLSRFSSPVIPTYIGQVIKTDEWVNYPWEPKENVFEDQLDYLESRINAIH